MLYRAVPWKKADPLEEKLLFLLWVSLIVALHMILRFLMPHAPHMAGMIIFGLNWGASLFTVDFVVTRTKLSYYLPTTHLILKYYSIIVCALAATFALVTQAWQTLLPEHFAYIMTDKVTISLCYVMSATMIAHDIAISTSNRLPDLPD